MDSGFLLTSGGTALISALVIQAIKNSQLSIFKMFGVLKENQTANLVLSILVAFITAIGISYKYDYKFNADTGEYVATFALSGLTVANVMHGIWHWFTQWAAQHLAYKVAVVPSEMQANQIVLQNKNIDVLNQLLNHLTAETTPVIVEKAAK